MAILTQIPPEDKEQQFIKQRQEPLAFLSGSFNGSSLNLFTADKEAYAIVQACNKLEDILILLRTEGFWLFTDHRNLIYIFDPVLANLNIMKHAVNILE